MVRSSEVWSSPLFPDVVVLADDRVPVLERERIASAIGRLLTRLDVADGARVRITSTGNAPGPLLAQVNLSVASRPARLQTLTRGYGDALPVVQRLEHLVATLSMPWQPQPWPDPAHQTLATPGPGQLTRRKSVRLSTHTPLSAAAVMDTMDYDAHLFTDTNTGLEAIVYRAGPDGLRLAYQHAHPPPPAGNGSGSLTTDDRRTPALTESQAADQVCERGLPYLFYTDLSDGRGHLIYRRYDTNLALISPAAAITDSTTS
jgi:hypothetical protein